MGGLWKRTPTDTRGGLARVQDGKNAELGAGNYTICIRSEHARSTLPSIVGTWESRTSMCRNALLKNVSSNVGSHPYPKSGHWSGACPRLNVKST